MSTGVPLTLRGSIVASRSSLPSFSFVIRPVGSYRLSIPRATRMPPRCDLMTTMTTMTIGDGAFITIADIISHARAPYLSVLGNSKEDKRERENASSQILLPPRDTSRYAGRPLNVRYCTLGRGKERAGGDTDDFAKPLPPCRRLSAFVSIADVTSAHGSLRIKEARSWGSVCESRCISRAFV